MNKRSNFKRAYTSKSIQPKIMKFNLLFTILISFCSICIGQKSMFFTQDSLKVCFAEEDSTQFVVENLNTEKYGILSLSGKEILPFRYDYLGRLIEGMRIAIIDSKYGFLNEKGEVAIEFKYYGGTNFSNEKAIVFNKNGFGVVDKNDNIFIPFEYSSLRTSDHKFYSFKKKGGKVGIMDFNEKVIVEPIYDNILLENDSIWICMKDRNFEVFKYNGKRHLEEVFNRIGRPSYSGYIIVVVDGKKGMLDEQFNWVIKPGDSNLKSLFTNYIGIKESDGWKVYDKNKIQVIDQTFNGITFLDKEHCIVNVEGKDIIIDKNGNIVLDADTKKISKIVGEKLLLLIDQFLYDGLSLNKIIDEPVSLMSNFSHVKNGMLPIMVNGKCAIIDTLGQFVIPPKYSRCEDKLEIGYLMVQDNETYKWGLLNLENELIIPMEYDYIQHSSGKGEKVKFWLEKDNTRSFYSNQKVLISGIDSLVNFLGDYTFFMKAGQLGMINTYKSSVKMLEYDSVIVDNVPFIVVENGKYGTLDSEGNLDLPIEYNYLEAAGSFLISKKGNKYGTISLDSKVIEVPQFDKIEKGLFTMFGKVYLGDKIGLLNSDGSLLLPIEYDELKVTVSGKVFAQKDDKSYQFDCLELQLKTLKEDEGRE